MNIGLFVYSYTGNTLSVAQRLKTKLEESGHRVGLESIKARNENPNQTQIDLTVIPDPQTYDQIILATPVRGFAVSPIMETYLEQWPNLNQKPVACFVTHAFPFAAMGGKSTIKMMMKLIQDKQATIVATGIIDWGNFRRETQIQKLIAEFTDLRTWA